MNLPTDQREIEALLTTFAQKVSGEAERVQWYTDARSCEVAAAAIHTPRTAFITLPNIFLAGQIEEVTEAAEETEATEADLLAELREIRSRLDRLETRLGR